MFSLHSAGVIMNKNLLSIIVLIGQSFHEESHKLNY